jgi:hypothetical protein
MWATSWIPRPEEHRRVAAVLFFLSGTWTTLILLFSASSFWYLPCGILWALSAVVWLIEPLSAPGLCIFPVLGVAVMLLQPLSALRHLDRNSDYWLFSIAVPVVLALSLIAFSLRNRNAWKVWAFVASLGLVLISFAVDRLFTNELTVHTYEMSWSINGEAPWGQVQIGQDGQTPVLVYRKILHGYCYDAVFSPELKSRLIGSKASTVTVEYNTFRDFGRERGYNIHSVDGLVFNDAHRAIREEEGYGGTVLDSGANAECGR